MEYKSWFKKKSHDVVANVVGGIISGGILLLASSVFAFFKLISLTAVVSLSFSVLGLFFIVYGVSRGTVERHRRFGEVLNPFLFIKDKNIECEITKTRGCSRTDTIVIKALKNGVREFKFNVIKTAAIDTKLRLVKGGNMTHRPDSIRETEYKVKFDPLKKKDEHTIILKWEIANIYPAPFLHTSFANVGGFEHLKINIIFSNDDLPKQVRKYKKFNTGSKVRSPKTLRLVKNTSPETSQVIWNIGKRYRDKANPRLAYWVEWTWTDRIIEQANVG